MRLLVTGGAGFIGSNFVRMVLEEQPDCLVVNLDKLTYAGNLENLAGIVDHPKHRFVRGDICDAGLVARLMEAHRIEVVVHMAAESHVDRSLMDADAFVDTNVRGTLTLLKAALDRGVDRFVQVSTDEVYGSLGPEGAFSEESPIRPNSPYSASKAAADHLVHAFGHSWGLPINITRCSNNYGAYQFPEKMIPLMIHNALHDEALPVYGDGLYVRDWLYVGDHCRALWTVLTSAPVGRVYNIGGQNERTNLDVVRMILDRLGKGVSLIRHVKDRPGHDRRYAIDAGRIRGELGWAPSVTFEDGLARTIDWYCANTAWLEHVVSGQYRAYYEQWYGQR